jgi:hypothetical protein
MIQFAFYQRQLYLVIFLFWISLSKRNANKLLLNFFRANLIKFNSFKENFNQKKKEKS